MSSSHSLYLNTSVCRWQGPLDNASRSYLPHQLPHHTGYLTFRLLTIGEKINDKIDKEIEGGAIRCRDSLDKMIKPKMMSSDIRVYGTICCHACYRSAIFGNQNRSACIEVVPDALGLLPSALNNNHSEISNSGGFVILRNPEEISLATAQIKMMALSDPRSIRVKIHPTSSRQRAAKSSQEGGQLGNNFKQDQEGLGSGKLKEIKLEEGPGQGKLYSLECAGGAKVMRGVHGEFSSVKQNEIDQGKLYRSENGICIETQTKGLNNKEEDEDAAIGHEKFYSSDHVKTPTNGKESGSKLEQLQLWNKGMGVLEASKGVAADIRRSLFHVKDRLMDKLAAVPIPAEALDNTRQSVESIIKDMTHAAQGKTKDALQRIKARLVEILPSLSPNQSEKIVDDVEREVMDMSDAAAAENSSTAEGKSLLGESNKKESQPEEAASASKSSFISPASSFSINIGRLKRPWTPRSRM